MPQYTTRRPFSVSRPVEAAKTGQAIYKAQNDAWRAFSDPQGDALATGPKQNLQILWPLLDPNVAKKLPSIDRPRRRPPPRPRENKVQCEDEDDDEEDLVSESHLW